MCKQLGDSFTGHKHHVQDMGLRGYLTVIPGKIRMAGRDYGQTVMKKKENPTKFSNVTGDLHASGLNQIYLDRANVCQKPTHVSTKWAVLHVPCVTAVISEIISHS